MNKVVIFGAVDVAALAHRYFEKDSSYSVAAFTIDGAHLKSDTYDGKPIVPFEEVTELYPPDEYAMFVGVSYTNLNKLRETKCEEAKAKGYSLVSYISSKCTYLADEPPGENSFIFEDNTVQPYVKIGKNVILWSGNHIGHHSVIEDHSFVTSHAVISGRCTIGHHSFLGVNSTLAHGVTLGANTIVGAGATITKDTEPYSVYVPARSTLLDRRADEIDL